MKPKEARKLGPFEAAREILTGFQFGASGWSDRDAVLSAAATAEALLQIILMSYFTHDDKTVDEALTSTLRGLKARVDVAYCIGALEHDLFARLRAIARIRNEFAHDITVWLLDDKRLRPDLSALGIPDGLTDFAPLHEAFVGAAESVLSRLYQVALYVWWKEGTLPPLEPPPEEKWRELLRAKLPQVGGLDGAAIQKLSAFGITTVEDALSAKSSPLIDALGHEAHRVVTNVHLWVISQLYPSEV